MKSFPEPPTACLFEFRKPDESSLVELLSLLPGPSDVILRNLFLNRLTLFAEEVWFHPRVRERLASVSSENRVVTWTLKLLSCRAPLNEEQQSGIDYLLRCSTVPND